MKQKFNKGDKLEALSFEKEEYGVDYVTISSVNEIYEVYHWEINNPYGLGGKVSSGYFFDSAKPYKEKQ